MGRRLKLTKRTQEDVCAALAIGCTYAAAAVNADIGYSTLRSWILYGERAREEAAAGTVLSSEDAKYLAFLEAVEGAKAEALLKWQQTVNRAAEVDPAWAWKMLQVRAPEDYTSPQQVEVTGAGGGSLNIQMTWGDNDGSDGDASPD